MSVEGLAVRLPEPATPRRWTRSLAVLDAVLSPEWEYRYFSFDAAWGPDQQLASMRNGSGDDWSITFAAAGTYVRGFDHESARSPFAQHPPGLVPRMHDGLPDALREAADEPAFTMGDLPLVTVALWPLPADASWSFGDVEAEAYGDDGGTWLFAELDGRPETYSAFATAYYERDVPLDAVRRVLAGEPLTQELVTALDPGLRLGEIAEEVSSTGYPLAR